MQRLRMVLRLLPLCMLVTATAYADTAVNVSANILESSCKVAASSLEQSVDLGKGRVADLIQASDATAWKAFSVEFTDCPDSVTQVVATLNGAPDVDAAKYYLNTGTAKKVAIEVQNAEGNLQLSNGKSLTTTVDEHHNAALLMKGRMISPTGVATPGSVVALLELSFDFN